MLVSSKSYDNDTNSSQKKPETRQNSSALHNRRPSGLPLVNRKMTPNDVIMLETYRKQVHSSKGVAEIIDPAIITCSNFRNPQLRCKSINLYQGQASNV